MILASEIEKTYKRVFTVSRWEKLFGTACIRLADAEYRPINIDKLLEVLEKDKTDQMTYSMDGEDQPIELFDCDDFTFALMGAFHKNYETAAMPIFITWVTTIQHALVSFYYDNKIFIIEPQTDEIYYLPEGEWKLSLICG